MGIPMHVNFGDFASSTGLEQLLDQLAQLHQPASDPAARAVVEALPKRLVAPEDNTGPGESHLNIDSRFRGSPLRRLRKKP